MSSYVKVQLSFPVNSIKALKKAASKALCYQSGLSEDEKDDFEDCYTKLILEQIVNNKDKYVHCGNKGKMFIWSGVWNYYCTETEIPYLKRFLEYCWKYEKVNEDSQNIAIFQFHNVLLITNIEDSTRSTIYEFSLNEEKIEKDGKVEVMVRKEESALSWHKYN